MPLAVLCAWAASTIGACCAQVVIEKVLLPANKCSISRAPITVTIRAPLWK
jgi:hypothetical protein